MRALVERNGQTWPTLASASALTGGCWIVACQSDEFVKVHPEASESLLAEQVRQLKLGVASGRKRRALKSDASGSQLDDARSAVVGVDGTLQVAVPLEVADELMDRLLGDLHVICDLDRPSTLQSTVTDDVKHYVTGSPLGELTGKESAGAFYAELFKGFQGEGVEPVARWHGHNFVVDEIIWTGHIENSRLFGLPGRRAHASFRLLHVIEFRDGKISRENVWPDTAAILAQTHETTSAQDSQHDG